MSTTFQQAFSYLVQTRVFEGSCLTEKDPTHLFYYNKGIELFEKLSAVLSEEHQVWLNELEAEWATSESFSIENAYKQGLKDGILFSKEIGLSISEGGMPNVFTS